jgi:hypothetical protein
MSVRNMVTRKPARTTLESGTNMLGACPFTLALTVGILKAVTSFDPGQSAKSNRKREMLTEMNKANKLTVIRSESVRMISKLLRRTYLFSRTTTTENS